MMSDEQYYFVQVKIISVSCLAGESYDRYIYTADVQNCPALANEEEEL